MIKTSIESSIIYVLGEKGVYTGSTGLQIAYLSGLEGLTHTPTHFTAEDAQALQLPLVSDSKFTGVDIFLTSQWPKGVEKYGSTVVRYTVHCCKIKAED